LQGPRPHDDWLWRIAQHNGLKRKHFKKIEKRGYLKPNETIRKRRVEIAPNYIIFSSSDDETYVPSNPRVVALYSKGNRFEKWEQDKFSKGVKRRTLGKAEHVNGRKRYLRTTNLNQPHRHIVFELPQSEAEAWRADFLKFIRRHTHSSSY
jgi:hypothetical protein